MDFKFSDEQEQFRDALRRYLAREYAFDVRQKIVTSTQGTDDKHWAAFTELGGTTQDCGFDDGLYINPGPWRIPYFHGTARSS